MMMNILFRVIRAVIFFMYEINGYSAIISKDPVSTSCGMKYFAIWSVPLLCKYVVSKYFAIWSVPLLCKYVVSKYFAISLSNTVKTFVIFISFVKFVPILVFHRISLILSYNPSNILKWLRQVINASARNGWIELWGCGLLPLWSDRKYSFNINMVNWEDVVTQLWATLRRLVE